jgi:hypothetical protein
MVTPINVRICVVTITTHHHLVSDRICRALSKYAMLLYGAHRHALDLYGSSEFNYSFYWVCADYRAAAACSSAAGWPAAVAVHGERNMRCTCGWVGTGTFVHGCCLATSCARMSNCWKTLNSIRSGASNHGIRTAVLQNKRVKHILKVGDLSKKS